MSRVCHFKLVLLGDTAVGKSCLVVRFVRDEFFEFQEPTIGGEFMYSEKEDSPSVVHEVFESCIKSRGNMPLLAERSLGVVMYAFIAIYPHPWQSIFLRTFHSNSHSLCQHHVVSSKIIIYYTSRLPHTNCSPR